MIKRLLLITVLFLFEEGHSSDFYGYWGDGRAEISSYDIKVPQYQEMRSGRAVLIYVTEDLNKETSIKAESLIPEDDVIYVMKLNHIIRFNTGIYDYSVMSSVFSDVVGTYWPFALRKVTMTSQDWCGHTFDEVIINANNIKGRINSYFERDSLTTYSIPVSSNFLSGDGLLIRIRELNGEWLKPDQRVPISLFPSLWGIRLRGLERKINDATLIKGLAENIEVGSEVFSTHKWTLTYGKIWQKYWVEREYPHRIVAWQFSDGEKAALIETERLSYWLLNQNKDSHYRKSLDLNW